MISTADLVAKARAESGLSQQGLADRAGCTRSTIARIESSRMEPTMTMLSRITSAAGRRLVVSVADHSRRSSLASLAAAGNLGVGDQIDWTSLRAFVDRARGERTEPLRAVSDPPERTGSPQMDNLLAAVAEKIADDAGVERPFWTSDVPALEVAWEGAGTPAMRAAEEAAAPPQFRARNIMLAEENLWRSRDPTTA